jgi:hypothetical protein
MKLKQLIKRLNEISKECNGRNPEVYFDSEAALFPTHLIKLLDINYLSKKDSGVGAEFVYINYDYHNTPCLHLTNDQRDFLKESMIKEKDYTK